MTAWCLKGAPVDGNLLLVPMRSFPMTIGRSAQCSLTIESKGVSRVHARLEKDPRGALFVTDLGSTNGTYLNRQRITTPTYLKEGDVLHFGTAEFRLSYAEPETPPENLEGTGEKTGVFETGLILPENFLLLETEFREMLDRGQLHVAWQPIVDFQHREIFAYEVLGRGGHKALPQSPAQLLYLAEKLDKEAELSHVFRILGALSAASYGSPVRLFMNSHPKEAYTEAFYDSITQMKRLAPQMELVIEIHEALQSDQERMKSMVERLRLLDVRIAYDDFGAGQARIREIAEIPAEIVKFDMSLIRDIHIASEKKQQMLAHLVKIVADLGSHPLAEGVETEEEATVCRQMGFVFCQGYLTGRPVIMV